MCYFEELGLVLLFYLCVVDFFKKLVLFVGFFFEIEMLECLCKYFKYFKRWKFRYGFD